MTEHDTRLHGCWRLVSFTTERQAVMTYTGQYRAEKDSFRRVKTCPTGYAYPLQPGV